MLDAALQGLVLTQQHQVHIPKPPEFVGASAGMSACGRCSSTTVLRPLAHRARSPRHLLGLDEVMRTSAPAGRHQHGAANGNARTANCKPWMEKSIRRSPCAARPAGQGGPGRVTPPRQTCRQSAPAGRPWLLLALSVGLNYLGASMASIITPMMLLALISAGRPAHENVTRETAASLVSLRRRGVQANLLLMVVRVLIMDGTSGLVCGAAMATCMTPQVPHDSGRRGIQGFGTVADRAQQHGKVDPGDQAGVHSSTRRWATLQGVAPNTSVSTRVDCWRALANGRAHSLVCSGGL